MTQARCRCSSARRASARAWRRCCLQIAADALGLPMERLAHLPRLHHVREGRLRRLPLALGGHGRHRDPDRRSESQGGNRQEDRARCPAVGDRPEKRRTAFRGRNVPQPQAHLCLRRGGGARRGGSANRAGRARRLRDRGGHRQDHQSADRGRAGGGRRGPGPRRRVPRASAVRRERPVPHRLARRLPAAEQHRFPEHPRIRHRGVAFADQPARGKGRRRRRHRSGGWRSGQRRGGGARAARRRAAQPPAFTAARLGSHPLGQAGVSRKTCACASLLCRCQLAACSL